MSDIRSSAPLLAGPRRHALVPVAAVGAGVAWALAALPFGDPFARGVGVGIYCLLGVMVIDGLGGHHPHARFGLGNGITLLRGGGAAVFAALALEPDLVSGGAAWWALAAAVGLLALDGLDGWAARRQGVVSAFGARFDMEVDEVTGSSPVSGLSRQSVARGALTFFLRWCVPWRDASSVRG
jgi:hypothetical protein